MAKEIDILREYVKQNGLKGTAQRERILEFLLGAGRHVSPEEVYDALRKSDDKLGRATVFRTLKLLEECGLASRVTFADGRQRFEPKYGRPHHDHMICVECGGILEFESPMMERFQDEAIKRHGFTALWHRHEIFGRCRACAHRGGRRG